MIGFRKLVFSLIALCACPLIAEAQELAEPQQRYAAKMICGTQPDPESLQLVRGVYATIVNVLNIGADRQDIALRLALAHPPVPPQPGDVRELPVLTLNSGQAGAVDCDDIRALLYPFGMPATHVDGFLVVDSAGELSVKAVYTAAPLIDQKCCKAVPGPVASIDVELISAAAPPAESARQPDLVPRQPVLETDPLGQPGTGFCTDQSADGGPPDAIALIVNQGELAAPATLSRFDFGGNGQVDAEVPSLATGASHSITAPIPTACFGSGRDDTCVFDVIADAESAVDESLETNNIRRGHCLRATATESQP